MQPEYSTVAFRRPRYRQILLVKGSGRGPAMSVLVLELEKVVSNVERL